MPLDEVAPSKEELRRWMARFAVEQQPFVEGFNVFNGKVYSWLTGTDGGRRMIFWNQKLFREAGLRGPDGGALAPETWEETRLAARKVTELGQGRVYGIIHGIKDGSWDQDLYYSLAPAAGWAFMHGFDFRTGLFDFHHPGLRGSIQLWLDMREDGSIFPGDLSMDREQAKFRFSQNLAGMTLDGPWLPSGLLAMNDSLEFDTALPPLPKRGERLGGLPVGPLASNSEYYVSSRTKRPDLVWKVIEFMTSQEYQEGWVEAGGGSSVFPEFNRPEFFPHPTIAKIAQMGAEGRRAFPEKVWSVDMIKVWPLVIYNKPDYWEVMQGMWVGMYGWKTWDEMEVRDNKRFDEALAEINKAEGLNLKRSDYVFPDWDPTIPFGRSESRRK